ncbi:MAG: class I adenylate-forming enzyme family protein, partial [Syntrophales bacterium]|nr:class I adenylate-forming enzyme family protein [Syntrophales bacterium]
MKDIDITKINMTTGELLKTACATDREKLFIYFIPGESGETFGEFEEKVNRLSNYMERILKIRKGDKVCTMAENSPELLHTIISLNCVGAVWVPLNNQLIGESLKYIIEDSDAGHVFASAIFEERIRDLHDQMRPVEIHSIGEVSDKSAAMPKTYDSQSDPDEINVIIYTSGTTGFPKGVMHTHLSNIRVGARSLGILETTKDERIHVYLPFFHAWAYAILMGALYYRASLYIDKAFNAGTYWADIDKYSITQDHWTGTVPVGLMKLPSSAEDKQRSLKIFGTFGALYEQMIQRWPRLRFQSLYGQTEHPAATAVPPDQIFQGSDGLPKSPDEILIVDDNGNILSPGPVGEIVIRCRCGAGFQGYYKNSAATAATLKGRDIYTGD